MTRRAVPISIKILSTLAAAGVVALSVLTARAAEQKTTRESPLAERGIETLLALKDGKTDEKRTPAQEIELRRKAVLEAIKLSLREIEGLEGKLETLPLPQRAEAELKEAALTTEKRNRSPEEVMRDAHLDSLKSARVLYEAASDTAQKARSLDEIKTIAREIQTYRKAAYNDKLQGIIDFILLSQTRHLIEVTSARWEKIAGDLEKLTRLVAANRERLERDMARARSHIGEARELSERAAELILPPKADTETDQEKQREESIPANAAEAEDKSKKAAEPDLMTPPPKPRELLEKALANLRSSYTVFIEVGSSTQKILHP